MPALTAANRALVEAIYQQIPDDLLRAKFNQVTAEWSIESRRSAWILLRQQLLRDDVGYNEVQRNSKAAGCKLKSDGTIHSAATEIKKLAIRDLMPNADIPMADLSFKWEPVSDVGKNWKTATAIKAKKHLVVCRAIVPSSGGWNEVHLLNCGKVGTLRQHAEGMAPRLSWIDIKVILVMLHYNAQRRQKFLSEEYLNVGKPPGLAYLEVRFLYHGEKQGRSVYSLEQEDNAYGEKFSTEMMMPVFYSDVFTSLVCNRCTNKLTNTQVYGAHASIMALTFTAGSSEKEHTFSLVFHDSQINLDHDRTQLGVFKDFMKPLLEDLYISFTGQGKCRSRFKCSYGRGYGTQQNEYNCAAYAIALDERVTRRNIGFHGVDDKHMPHVCRATGEVMLRGGYTQHRPTLEHYYHLFG